MNSLKCEEIGVHLYKVFSNDKEYIVNYEVECCTCYIGKLGAPCKHQFAVIKKYSLPSQQFCPTLVDSNFKKLLHKIITGKDCDLTNWYKEFGEVDLNQNINVGEESRSVQDLIVYDHLDNKEEGNDENDECDMVNTENQLNDVFEKIKGKFRNNPEEYKKPISKFIKLFNTCKSDSSLISALQTFGKYNGAGMPLIKKGKNTQGGRTIGVHPTALSRRKTKLAGRRVLQSVRPSKRQKLSDHCYSKRKDENSICGVSEVKKASAAPHSLQYCVDNNIVLGRTHSKK